MCVFVVVVVFLLILVSLVFGNWNKWKLDEEQMHVGMNVNSWSFGRISPTFTLGNISLCM